MNLTPAEAQRLFDEAMLEDDEIKNSRRTPLETYRHQLGLGPQDELPMPRENSVLIGKGEQR